MQRLRFVALIIWAVGVQVHELMATLGIAVFAFASLPELLKVRSITLPVIEEWGPLFAFATWSLLAPTLTGFPPDGSGVGRTLDWVTIPLVMLAAQSLTSGQWKWLAIASFVTLGLSCLVAGLQHFGWWPPLSAFAPLAHLPISFSRVYEPIADSSRFMGGGLLFHRLKFSHVSGLALVAVVVVARYSKHRALLIALGLFGFIAVWLFPYARMGAVAMTLSVGMTVVLVSPSPAKAFLFSGALGLAAVLVVVAVPSLRARFAAGLTDQGSGQRSQHVAAGLEAVRQHPLAGVGPGQFRPSKFGGAQMAEHVKDNPGKAHNEFVSIAAETGIPGLVIFLATLGMLLKRARKPPMGAMAIGAIALFVVLSMAHDPLYQAPFSMGLALIIGLGLGAPTPPALQTPYPRA